MAPRTNYSRVNTGASPTADLGASAQKTLAPDTQSFLPHKVAHIEVPMSTVSIPMTIQQMVKAAAAGAADHLAVSLEAERQSLAPAAPLAKTAAATEDSIPTAYVEKLAEAMEFIMQDKEASPGPGAAPNALTVSESRGGTNPFMPGNQGQATPAHIPPMTPGTHKPSETPKGPSNALDTNASMSHPAVKHAGVAPDDLRKAAAARQAELSKTAKSDEPEKEVCKGCGKEKDACTCSKTAGANPALVDFFLSMTKSAEDAINPAKISAGAAVAPQTSASGEDGGSPAGGKPKGATGLIASNDAAINYTRRQAKAGTKAEMAKVLTEPALSAEHDKTLGMAFANTGKAGVKIAESARSAAARVILEKMASEAETEQAKKKKKESAGASFTAPPVGGVASSGGGM